MYRLLALLLLALTQVLGYEQYRDAIPNGHAVPNPCFKVKDGQDEIWGGVGHQSIGGGGPLNPFGEAFKANNLAYSAALCKEDSDGDGLTNGEELGDPTCVWTVGKNTTHGPRGHPGICEPVGSQWCQKSWFSC